MLLPLLAAFQLSADTLTVRSLDRPPAPAAPIDSARLGPSQVRLLTRQGTASIWLLRSADTFFIAATIPDSTPYWGDDFVISLDTRGDAAPNPQHDDFQWYFRRVLDSSVVFRGRNGKWEPPRADPGWRLGRERSGGGWEVSARDAARGWSLLLRLDPAWFTGEAGRLPRLAFRIYDDSPSGWFAWPLPPGTQQASSIEQAPDLWVPARRSASE
jgi:hypothetical protein